MRRGRSPSSDEGSSKRPRCEDEGEPMDQDQPVDINEEELVNQPPQDQEITDYSLYGNDTYAVCNDPILGRGSYGDVLKTCDTNGVVVAIKVYNIAKEDSRETFYREVRMLQMIEDRERHENIVKYMQHDINRIDYRCIVFEVLGQKCLTDVMKEKKETNVNRAMKGFDLDEIREIGQQIVNALKFLEQQNIIHGDLNPNNIVFTDNNCDHIRLIDFGCSFIKNRSRTSRITHEIQKTLNYRAPEVFLGFQPYTHAIDVWSLGCLMVGMYSGEHIFNETSTDQQMMASIVELSGIPDPYQLARAPKFPEYFVSDESNELASMYDCLNGEEPVYTHIDGVTKTDRLTRVLLNTDGQSGDDFTYFRSACILMLDADWDQRELSRAVEGPFFYPARFSSRREFL